MTRLRFPTPDTKNKSRGPLQRWQLLFANWLLAEPKTPSKAQQCEAATRLANEKRPEGLAPVAITYRQLKTVKTRPDWQEYLKKVEQGGIEAARAMFASDLPLYIELRRWAAEHAKEAGDHRAMAALTEAAVDRAFPKREGVAVATQITITLAPGQLAGLDAPTATVEAEVVDVREVGADDAEEAPLSLPAPRARERRRVRPRS